MRRSFVQNSVFQFVRTSYLYDKKNKIHLISNFRISTIKLKSRDKVKIKFFMIKKRTTQRTKNIIRNIQWTFRSNMKIKKMFSSLENKKNATIRYSCRILLQLKKNSKKYRRISLLIVQFLWMFCINANNAKFYVFRITNYISI